LVKTVCVESSGSARDSTEALPSESRFSLSAEAFAGQLQPAPGAIRVNIKIGREIDMSPGLIGRKVGMTRVFADDGSAIPVTVLDVGNNRVTQVKTPDSDGYAAVQVTFGTRRASRVGKPMAGHLAKAGVTAGEVLREFPVSTDEIAKFKPGDIVGVDTFEVGQLVDVTGTTKGRGFSGVIRRHNFSSNRASHGNSRSHNTPGSISMAQDPGRVFPGKRMAGQYGNVTRTVQTLPVVRVDKERGLLLVKGCVPGADGGQVIVRVAAKTPAKKGA
jgi:large subunit ribosomal protein L3